MPVSDAVREGVIDVARQAAAAILEVYAGAFEVERKEDASPVTSADMAAHHVIVDGLRALTPDVPVLSEECADDVEAAERLRWTRLWLVDPLDGTREFIKRNGEFTVNIALVHGGRVELGIVYVPVTRLTYFACTGGGAFRQQADGAPQAIHVRALTGGPVVVAGSRSHGGESLQRFLAKLGPHELVSLGSALKSCLVAEGRADIYPRLGLTSEWDTAAAQCVVEEAGGRVTGLDLQPLRYNTKDSLLNPHFLVFGDASRDWSAYL